MACLALHGAESSNAPELAAGDGPKWRRGLQLRPQDVQLLNQARQDQFAIVEEIPVEKAGLGAFSVACLLFNRMIGSGIFNSSSVVFYNTQSIGASLLMWAYGVVMTLSGLVLYIELGLMIPRWQLEDGTKISTPRSGAELVYFNYFLKIPKYLATCVFGVSFLVFGNTATNSVAFAVAVLQAAGSIASPEKIVGIAIAANTFSCLLHSMSRKWGIWLNNLLGSLKLLMLVVMIIFGLSFLDRSVSDANFDSATAFSKTPKTPTGVYRYAEALIYVVFPFGGFHQANYVLAEIKDPRRNFAWTSSLGVGVVCTLFMTINILYAAIIPKEVLFEPGVDIALEFFFRTVGRIAPDPDRVRAACGALRALSAIGNVIVFTFTAARVKQEVAKEGIFPFSLYLASSYEFSFRHGFRRLPAHAAGHQLYTQKAPAAALALHWTVTTLLILAAVLGTAAGKASEETFSHLPGYSLLVMAYAYGLDIIWFTVIGVAMLRLRLWPGSTWRDKSPVPHALGVLAAVIFTATSVFPLVAIWVPDPMQPFMLQSVGKVPWFGSQTLALAVLAAAGAYWVGFRFYLRQRRLRHGEELHVTRHPVFWAAGGGRKGLVLLYEIIRLQWRHWVPKEKHAALILALVGIAM
ncbi:amino acid permease-domain-containing protein [Chaetomidium leptoderma]|uniref:Amino acid permease-domain-containing protein n=1 Tax=Chaetomidium leptoderma TaxID=669021 RepID=A0AAN6VJI7_9PEZI|nr:amino acid permease-domain-containing protein [Chaetomidium leptoderma]